MSHTEETVFAEALEKRDPQERAAFLDQVCGDDPALRAGVEALLSAYDEGEFLECPALSLAETVDAAATTERPDMVIGRYRLLEQIGEGAFGVVFMAEQLQPIRRKVALKVLKPGMDSHQVIARFEAERQALALMDHPNIAKVLDAGQTDSGRPYFVMDLVRGLPITRFCDQAKLPIRERLELFLSVCQAVQHAHQKGIIHRDIKPSNVLVTLHDGAPLAKVIDFGIAKALGQELTDKTLYTGFAQLIGTPLYMSPEQAAFSNVDVDTRSDIYSLGVLLYELLTGTTPFDKDRLHQAGYDELRRIIREEEPPKPSTRISTLGQAATAISTQRQSDPKRLGQFIRAELDWIVMKCLEKDRKRRYETANGLARDIERYLHDEPVQACPPSAGYRLRKFARRNKVALAMASVITLALAVVVVGLIALVIWRFQERQNLAEEKQKLAEDQAAQEHQALGRLNTANGFIEIGRLHAEVAEWAKAESQFSKAVECRPDSSHVWSERAGLYLRLGLWDWAVADLAEALKRQGPSSTNVWYHHALLCLHVGDINGYRRTCQRMAAHFAETTDPNFCEEIARTCLLVDDPVVERQDILQHAERAVSGGKTPSRLTTLGTAYYRAGQCDKALACVRESQARDENWEKTWNHSILAMAHRGNNQPDLARRALDAAAAAQEQRIQGMLSAPGHLPTYWWNILESDVHYREAKKLIDGAEPPDDPRLWVIRARALEALGQQREAVAGYTKALEVKPDFIRAWTCRGVAYFKLRQWVQARDDFAKVIELNPKSAWAHNELAWLLATCPEVKLREPQRAIAHAENAVALEPTNGNYWNTLGAARYRAEDWRGGVAALVKSLDLRQGSDLSDWFFLAMAHWHLDRKETARQWFAHALDQMERTAPADEQLKRFRAEAAALLGLPEKSSAVPPHPPGEDAAFFTLVLETDPSVGWAYERRGTVRARMNQWDEAAADFAKATECQPDDANLWYCQAAAHLGAGKVNAYRQVRAGILKQFGETTNPATASHLLYICVAAPAQVEESNLLVRLGELAVDVFPGNARVLGAAHYRAGQYDTAVHDFEKAAKLFRPRAWDWLFLAMAHHHLGHVEAANQYLKKAVEWIEQTNRKQSTGAGNPWISLFEPVEVQHLRREAEALLKGTGADQPQAQAK
jgi:serine/threonine protein kinase/Flp pilus assembly protein TadD